MNSPASVLARLRNVANGERNCVTAHLLQIVFCHEEFLRRVSMSRFRDNLILKGGLLLYIDSGKITRPTTDIDFRVDRLSLDEAAMMPVLEEIASLETGNSYISFELLSTERITEDREYGGIRINLRGYIGTSRVGFHIDLAVGDAIVPGARSRKMPTLLEGFEQPDILAYSLESVIAEKLDAIIQRMELSTRMKDFYDIYALATTRCFDAAVLQEAIRTTLQYRGTVCERDSLESIIGLADNAYIQQNWARFCRNSLKQDLELRPLLEVIYCFLQPLYDAITTEGEYFGSWDPSARGYTPLA